MKRFSTIFTMLAIFFLASSVNLLTAQNQVTNPGFENWTAGVPDDWTTSGGEITLSENNTDVHGGGASCDVVFTSQSNQNLKSASFNVTEGQEVNGSVWILDNDAAGRARISLVFDAGGNFYGDYSADDAAWQELSFTSTVPAGATSAYFQVRFYDVSANWDGDCEILVDDASLVAGTATTVATPVISPASGAYANPIDITMTCSTTGATIYYTTDGTDPDDNSTEYTASFQISTATTVKAIAYKAGMTESAIATNDYTFPTAIDISTIAQLRTQAVGGGDLYRLTGEAILTFQQDFRHQKYIQDATAGILIDDNSGNITTTYDIYDGITNIIGQLSEYGGMLQFVPNGDPGAATSTANTVTPQVVTLAQLGSNFDDYESQLVKVEHVAFADAGSDFANGTAYAISDASKASYNFRTTFYDVDYIGTTIPSGDQDLVLIPNSRTDGEYVTSRSAADITASSTSNPATKLDITSINSGNPVYENQAFTVTVQAQDANGDAANVDTDVDVTLTVGTGTGTLGGTITGTITTGTNSLTISGTTYGPHENGVILNVADDAGSLAAGNSDAFDVLEVVTANLVISEIMYKAMPGEDTLEYFELYNNGSSAINLENYEVTQGVDLTFGNETINAGQYLVVAKNASAMQDAFGVTAVEWTGGGLKNSGEDIEIKDPNDNVVAYVDYGNSDPWPTQETGKSIRFCDPSLDNNDAANWSISVEFLATVGGEDIYGTPGAGCGSATLSADFEADNTNITAGESVNFTDLSAGNPTSWEWTFSGGTPASSTDQNPANIVYDTPGDYDVSLTIHLGGDQDTETKTAYIHVSDPTNPPVADFEADQTTIFVGQVINFTDLSTNNPITWAWTFDGGTPASSTDQNPSITYNTEGTYDVTLYVENSGGSDTETKTAYITVLPASVGDIVITEIMYNPPESNDDTLEYIEIYNNSDNVVNLFSYEFNDGVTYIFPQIDLGVSDYLLIAKDSLAIMNTFGLTAYQWNSGSLSNGGELLKLVNPTGITVDSVMYADTAPWPEAADGNGPSITICDPSTENSVGDNWHASVNFLAVNANNDSIFGSPGMAAAPVADFVADVTSFPGTGGQVQFTDLSTCNADTYAWEFEGGTPATSSDTDPIITYSTAGDFDVTLTVSNNTGSNTLTMINYIHVGVGTMEQSLENISVMPNPSTGYFKIINPNHEEMYISVYSVLGEVIIEHQAVNGDDSIDLLSQENGVYLLQIIANGQKKTMRIIKQ